MNTRVLSSIPDIGKILAVAVGAMLTTVGCAPSSIQTESPTTLEPEVTTASSRTPTNMPAQVETSLPEQTLTQPPTASLEVTSVIGGSSSDYTVFLARESGLWLVFGSSPQRYIPDEVVIDAAVGPNHILALTETGTLYALGYNQHGQLGLSPSSLEEVPVHVPNLANLDALAAGVDFSIVLKDDGTVWAWGNNDSGQLGKQPSEFSSEPAQISGLSDIAAISSGGSYTLALRNDGVVFAWGANDAGQLGEGTTDPEFTPVQIQTLRNVVSIAAGFEHGLALKEDGTVWGWGANNRGQLGRQPEVSYLTVPTQVSGLSDIVAIAAGRDQSFAITRDGEVWAWGDNEVGQLGIGEHGIGRVEPNPTPVEVSGLIEIVAIAAGRYHAIALQSDGTLWGWGDALVLPGLGLDGESIQATPIQLHVDDSP